MTDMKLGRLLTAKKDTMLVHIIPRVVDSHRIIFVLLWVAQDLELFKVYQPAIRALRICTWNGWVLSAVQSGTLLIMNQAVSVLARYYAFIATWVVNQKSNSLCSGNLAQGAEEIRTLCKGIPLSIKSWQHYIILVRDSWSFLSLRTAKSVIVRVFESVKCLHACSVFRTDGS